MRTFFLQPVHDLSSALERLLLDTPRPARAAALALLTAAVTWFVYVPIHELLHVAGCLVTGGTISELQIAPHYGGALLARVFPFVVCGGPYAGRLSGFDTGGSDLVYLATDFAPFLLSVFIGGPLLRVCTKQHRPALFGVALVVGLAPLYNLFGDYYEMGSTITTRAIGLLPGGSDPGGAPALAALRSDDVFKLVGQVWSHPEELDLPVSVPSALVVVGASFVLGILLALVTYALGRMFAEAVLQHRSITGKRDR